jgi:mRNA interferase RelE/StbE
LVWKIKWDERAEKDLKKLDKTFAKQIIRYMSEKISSLSNPRALGKGLKYEKYGLWRYRVENYRVVCRIQDDSIEILVIRVGHRKDVYDE